MRWHDVALTWNHTKDHNCSRTLCFHQPGHVPVIRGNADLHFDGAGNGPVVITWIGRVHELYSGTSPISLVEHCITFRDDRRLLSLLGLVHNWPTSRWSATKKENRFSLNGNGIMSSFLGQKFYRSTLNFFPWKHGRVKLKKKTNLLQNSPKLRGCPRDVMVQAMDYRIVVCEFVLQSRYYVPFRVNTIGKGMNPLILPAMG